MSVSYAALPTYPSQVVKALSYEERRGCTAIF